MKRLLTAGLFLVWAALGLAQPGGALVGLATSIERRLCVTDGMPVQIQSVVWNDLLDQYACPWAEGESGQADVRQRLLENLHFSGRWIYTGGSTSYYTGTPALVSGIIHVLFKLKSLLAETQVQWFYGASGVMDCRDFSCFMILLMQSHGMYASGLQVQTPDPQNHQFSVPMVTNSHCRAGFDPTLIQNYYELSFLFHAVATSGGEEVIDPSVSHWVDLSGLPFRNPVNGWPKMGWFQTWNSVTSIYGFVRGTAIQSPMQVNGINSADFVVGTLVEDE